MKISNAILIKKESLELAKYILKNHKKETGNENST